MNTPMTLDGKMTPAEEALGGWLSAALDDPAVCAEMKRNINAWFAAIAARGEAVAWLAADGTGRVIDAKAKDAGSRAAATGSATAIYSIPLYTAPPAPKVDARGEPIAWKRETPYGVGYSFASEQVMKDMADWLAPKVDGYAVLLFDKASAPHGYWFAGIYHDKESAERLAKKNGKSEVRPMAFTAALENPDV